MAITALVKDGQVVDTGATTSSKTSTSGASTDNNAVDEDMFLQLLVAEMQYQDPLEPTSNTEWVSQYATFTQIEQMTAVSNSVQQMEASNLVGQQVIMKSVNETTGETNYFSGVVDYMYVENGEVFLSINDNLYSIKDLDTVVNPDYMDAVTKAQDFATMVSKLPSASMATLADKTLVEEIRKVYDGLSEYQKKYISESDLNTLKAVEAKIAELEESTSSETTSEETAEGSTEGGTEDTAQNSSTTDDSTTNTSTNG